MLVDHDDLTIDGILDESSMSSPCFVTDTADGNPDGSEEGPFPFTLWPLFKFIIVAEANAADGEPEDVGEEEDVFGALVLRAPGGWGIPDATPAGRVYEHWYVERPPRVRSSRIARVYCKHYNYIGPTKRSATAV